MSDTTTEVVNASWLQAKVARQRTMLHTLTRRVRAQRLILRELNETNPELALDLLRTVKEKYGAELDAVTGFEE